MSGGFTVEEGLTGGVDGATLASGSSTGTQVTSGAANTKGSFVTLVTATAFDASWMMVEISGLDDNWGTCAIDLAVGTSPSASTIFANNLYWNQTGGTNSLGIYSFPCNIPAGSRISARAMSETASATPRVSVQLFDAGFSREGAAGVDSIGGVFSGAGSPLGTQIDPGATANTKGSIAQLTAATPRDYNGLFFALDWQLQSGSPTSRGTGLLDIIIATNTVLIPNVQYYSDQQSTGSFGRFSPSLIPLIPISIPAGTRIAARAQCTQTASPARLLGVLGYGVYW